MARGRNFRLDTRKGTARGLVFLGGPGRSRGPLLHDESGYGNDGTLDGSATWAVSAERQRLVLDLANGTKHVDLGSPSYLSRSLGESITISAWVKRVTTGNAWHPILTRGSGTPRNYELTFTAGALGASADNLGLAFRETGDASWQLWATTNTFTSTSTWYHVALRYRFATAASMTCFVNGTFEAGSWTSGTGNVAPDTTSAVSFIGRTSNEEYLAAYLDDLRVYFRLLSDSEIQYIYQKTKADPYSDIAMKPSRVYKAAAVGGLSIPVAMHHYKQMMGV